MSRLLYRLRQGWMRLTIRPQAIDLAAARPLLSPEAMALFESMSLGDQRHSIAVMQRLVAQGHTEPILLQAALLHDVGRAVAHISLAHRTVIVLLRAIHAPWLVALASQDQRSARYPFYVHLHHHDLGAQACQRAGCDGQVVWLVAQHQRHPLPKAPDDHLIMLAALQTADDQC